MPPVVTKQTAAGSKPPPANGKAPPAFVAKPGSVLSMAFPIDQLRDDYVKLCLYGQNRVGKSTLACQFPKPLLLIAADSSKTGGAISVIKVAGVSYLRVVSSAQLQKLAGELATANPFKTVVIDSATGLQDTILTEILGLSATPTMLAWGVVSMDQYRERSERTREALRPFLDLPCHTVVTAKERDHNQQDAKNKSKAKMVRGLEVESFFAADLGGATAGWLNDASDYIGRLFIAKETARQEVQFDGDAEKHYEEFETGKLVRRLLTMYHPNFAAGFRSGSPEAVPEWINDPTWNKIAKVIRGERLSAKDAKYPD